MPTTWKSIAAFFALTILLLALIPILSALTGATMDFDAAAASATEKRASNKPPIFSLSFDSPFPNRLYGS